jgi:hypothetical protein
MSVSVPVPDLLQMMHGGYALVANDGVAKEHELPNLIDYARCLVQRFEHYGSLSVAPEDLFIRLCDVFQVLTECDEPTLFFEARDSAVGYIEELEIVMRNMSRAFTSSERISRHYNAVATTFHNSLRRLLGGEMCD